MPDFGQYEHQMKAKLFVCCCSSPCIKIVVSGWWFNFTVLYMCRCSVWHVIKLLLSTTMSPALLYILHPVLAGLAMSRWSGVRTMQGLYSLPSTVCTSVCRIHSRDWKVNYFVLVCILKFKVYLETVRNGVQACFLDLIDYTHRLLGCQVVAKLQIKPKKRIRSNQKSGEAL